MDEIMRQREEIRGRRRWPAEGFCVFNKDEEEREKRLALG